MRPYLGTVAPSNRRKSNAPGRNRTCGQRFRKPLLYPLSYEGDVVVVLCFREKYAIPVVAALKVVLFPTAGKSAFKVFAAIEFNRFRMRDGRVKGTGGMAKTNALGRRRGSRNKGYFFREGRGWFTKDGAKFVPLADESGNRLRARESGSRIYSIRFTAWRCWRRSRGGFDHAKPLEQ
jgi:hypothetical protein